MPDLTATEASDVAIHKAKSAQAAVEIARELQQEELVEKTAQKTKAALLEGLREVFDGGDESDNMIVRWKRIPFLCTSVEEMHRSIDDIKSDLRWMKWIGSGFVAAAGLLALKSLGL